MILAGAHAGPRHLERFQIEAEAVARLQHPGFTFRARVMPSDGFMESTSLESACPRAVRSILHRPDRSLVAVLEMLSPYNKTGDGFLDYRGKRKAILQQRAHLVGLDLLLGGTRLPLLEPLPSADYYAFLSRADRRPYCEVYSWTIRQALPTIPIPLRSPDADVLVDLESVFQAAYERGRYEHSLSYGRFPVAPLNEVDRQWATEVSSARRAPPGP